MTMPPDATPGDPTFPPGGPMPGQSFYPEEVPPVDPVGIPQPGPDVINPVVNPPGLPGGVPGGPPSVPSI